MDIGQHTFTVDVEWQAGEGPGTTAPRDFHRRHTITAVLSAREQQRGEPTPAPLQGSAARPFHGDADRWNPEQLLVAALCQCHTLSYLYLAAESGVVVTAMTTRGTADLRVEGDGAGQITAAVLRPEVTLADESQRAEADALHLQAAEKCFIARSVNFPVTHEPRMPTPAVSEGDPAGSTTGNPTGNPVFSRRLGAPIATLRPTGKAPSQVTGRPGASAPGGPPASVATPPTTPATPAASGASGGGEQQSFYEAVGGHETFRTIVDTFYAQVADDPEFRAMYPEEDLGPAAERLLMFLEQCWGGPRTYQERRGHPRLRMRHMPFTIDAAARDTWLRYMRTAVDAAELSPLHDEILWDYLERAAHSMVNS